MSEYFVRDDFSREILEITDSGSRTTTFSLSIRRLPKTTKDRFIDVTWYDEVPRYIHILFRDARTH